MNNAEIKYISDLFYDSRSLSNGLADILAHCQEKLDKMHKYHETGCRTEALESTVYRLEESLCFMQDIHTHCKEIMATYSA